MLAPDACEGDPQESDPIQRVLVGQFTDSSISDSIQIKNIRNNPNSLTKGVNLALTEQNFLKRVNLRKKNSRLIFSDKPR